MSTLETNLVQPSTGTTLTLGASGDTVDVPSGATLDVNGTIDLTGATKTGFPAAGITHASIWDMNTTFSGSSEPITTNWAESTSSFGYGTLGSSMTQSSGVFTFPATGYWLISWNVNFQINNASSRYNNIYINTTTDNGTTWTRASMGRVALYNSGNWTYQSAPITWFFDVTNVSTHKCRFGVSTDNSNTEITQSHNSSSDSHGTAVTFIRLADT